MKQVQKDVKKIVLTGGHAGATAYAVIQELKKRLGDWEICWVGSKYALEGKRIPTYEGKVFPKIGVSFYSIFSGRLQRKFTFWTIPSILKIPLSFIHAFFILAKIKPKVTLSFGGYSAFPVVVVSWLFRIPVVIHEQTIAVGRTNKYSAAFSTVVALARKDSIEYFPKEKCVVVGNPISDEIQGIRMKKKISSMPTLFITGGSRGSTAINNLIDQILEELLSQFRVVHQTGIYQYKKFVRRRNSLQKENRKNYDVYDFIEPWHWYKFIEASDIIVSRAGANIVSEILVSKRPSILIPLPIAYLDEQKKNAQFARDFGIAAILDQEDLTSETLKNEIYKVRKNWGNILKDVAAKESPDINADKKLVELIEKMIR